MVCAKIPFPLVCDLCGQASNVRLTFDENVIICEARIQLIPGVEPMTIVVSLNFDLNSTGSAEKKRGGGGCVHLRSL
jgi:hypothetical protein